MAFNPETACKALENRIKDVERTTDELQKQLRAADSKSLSDRIIKLEALVKIMTDSREDTRVNAIEKTIKTLRDADYADRAFVEKLWDEYRKESDAERGRAEKARQAEDKKWDDEQKAMVDKVMKEAKAQQEKALADAMKAMLEGRLAKLEAQVAALSR